jgi:hypothetical protein
MIGMIAVRAKRGIQWDRAQILVQKGSRVFLFLTVADLYFDMNNIAILKGPNT